MTCWVTPSFLQLVCPLVCTGVEWGLKGLEPVESNDQCIKIHSDAQTYGIAKGSKATVLATFLIVVTKYLTRSNLKVYLRIHLNTQYITARSHSERTLRSTAREQREMRGMLVLRQTSFYPVWDPSPWDDMTQFQGGFSLFK